VKLEFNNIGLSDLNHVAEKIISVYNNDRIFCFYGIMGSGKTTLIKSICNYLGVKI